MGAWNQEVVLGQASEWVKWTNEIGAFITKTDILDVGPVWIFAPTACPRTGPIPAQSRSPWVLGTRRSSWGRPSEWVKWTNEIGAFHHKTDILDVGPVWIFAPTACPRTGPIPAQSRSPWVLGTRRSSWGRPSEWVKWTNEIGAFHHKTDILDVGPVWIFAPTACPRTGPIPAHHSDGPPGSKHPWGPRLGWYRSRPGASRRGEYPNGSNIKNIRFVMKCTNFVGPFDPFRRPAPGRPPGSKHPWGPRLGWYRSRPGASRRGEYPNGSNIKNIRFVMKCTNFVGPFDPFRRPAPGRPPGSKHQDPYNR